jgi:hypothetical protein
MDCPVCGAANEPGAAFCYRCGSALRPGGPSAQPPATGQTMDLGRAARGAAPGEQRPSAWDGPSVSQLGEPPSLPLEPAAGSRVYNVPATPDRPSYIVGPAPVMTQTSNLALFSLILGILSWVFLPFIAAIGAVITGHMARREIRGAAGRFTGEGLATAGLILGYLNLGLSLLVLCLFVFLILGAASS